MCCQYIQTLQKKCAATTLTPCLHRCKIQHLFVKVIPTTVTRRNSYACIVDVVYCQSIIEASNMLSLYANTNNY